jgi:hypothetical protein
MNVHGEKLPWREENREIGPSESKNPFTTEDTQEHGGGAEPIGDRNEI